MEPQRVGQSAIKLCCGKFFSICIFTKSLRLFQLTENASTMLRATPKALVTLRSSLMAFVTAKLRQWPKHESLPA